MPKAHILRQNTGLRQVGRVPACFWVLRLQARYMKQAILMLSLVSPMASRGIDIDLIIIR